ncbi:hypothetical protein [Streptomyces abikoensis]
MIRHAKQPHSDTPRDRLLGKDALSATHLSIPAAWSGIDASAIRRHAGIPPDAGDG